MYIEINRRRQLQKQLQFECANNKKLSLRGMGISIGMCVATVVIAMVVRFPSSLVGSLLRMLFTFSFSCLCLCIMLLKDGQPTTLKSSIVAAVFILVAYLNIPHLVNVIHRSPDVYLRKTLADVNGNSAIYILDELNARSQHDDGALDIILNGGINHADEVVSADAIKKLVKYIEYDTNRGIKITNKLCGYYIAQNANQTIGKACIDQQFDLIFCNDMAKFNRMVMDKRITKDVASYLLSMICTKQKRYAEKLKPLITAIDNDGSSVSIVISTGTRRLVCRGKSE